MDRKFVLEKHLACPAWQESPCTNKKRTQDSCIASNTVNSECDFCMLSTASQDFGCFVLLPGPVTGAGTKTQDTILEISTRLGYGSTSL